MNYPKLILMLLMACFLSACGDSDISTIKNHMLKEIHPDDIGMALVGGNPRYLKEISMEDMLKRCPTISSYEWSKESSGGSSAVVLTLHYDLKKNVYFGLVDKRFPMVAVEGDDGPPLVPFSEWLDKVDLKPKPDLPMTLKIFFPVFSDKPAEERSSLMLLACINVEVYDNGTMVPGNIGSGSRVIETLYKQEARGDISNFIFNEYQPHYDRYLTAASVALKKLEAEREKNRRQQAEKKAEALRQQWEKDKATLDRVFKSTPSLYGMSVACESKPKGNIAEVTSVTDITTDHVTFEYEVISYNDYWNDGRNTQLLKGQAQATKAIKKEFFSDTGEINFIWSINDRATVSITGNINSGIQLIINDTKEKYQVSSNDFARDIEPLALAEQMCFPRLKKLPSNTSATPVIEAKQIKIDGYEMTVKELEDDNPHSGKIFINNQLIYDNEDADKLYFKHIEPVQINGMPGWEAVLQTSSGGTACPAMYRFISITAEPRAYVSESFGTCSDLDEISSTGAYPQVTMPDYNGSRGKLTYRLENGKVIESKSIGR